MFKFSDFALSDTILNALNKIEIDEPTDIQRLAIPPMMDGKDVIGQAQTGTGKTFAYSIPIVEAINDNESNVHALILCPTRELSIQVSVEIKKLVLYKKKIKIATIYGGESYEKQFKALKDKPQIIVGTPGRIIDHLNRGTLSFSSLKILVLDEADEMLKMGFQDDLETILSNSPKNRQTALFSATMPPYIESLAKRYLFEPQRITIEKRTLTVDKIEQELFYVKKENKKDLLIRLLDYNNFNSCIIFCNTKSMVDELVLFLQKNKYLVDGLHGDLKQMVRDRVMNGFRSGTINILIATDVAARGIDVDGLEAIINYDIPLEDELYVHRIGRTGRAGQSGVSITFASPREQYKVREIERYTKSNMKEGKIPTIEDIRSSYAEKLYNKVISKIGEKNSSYDKMIFKLAKNDYETIDIVRALVSIACEKNEREYKDIDVYPIRANKQKKNINNKTRQAKEKKKSKSIVKLNMGKKELLRPQLVVNLCNKIGGIHKERIGNIQVLKDYTLIEVDREGLKYMKSMNGKIYQNKKINVSIVNSIPKN